MKNDYTILLDKELKKAYKGTTAKVLGYMIYRHNGYTEYRAENDNWFFITDLEFRNALGISSPTLRLHISKLISDGMIEKNSGKRNTANKYRLSTKLSTKLSTDVLENKNVTENTFNCLSIETFNENFQPDIDKETDIEDTYSVSKKENKLFNCNGNITYSIGTFEENKNLKSQIENMEMEIEELKSLREIERENSQLLQDLIEKNRKMEKVIIELQSEVANMKYHQTQQHTAIPSKSELKYHNKEDRQKFWNSWNTYKKKLQSGQANKEDYIKYVNKANKLYDGEILENVLSQLEEQFATVSQPSHQNQNFKIRKEDEVYLQSDVTDNNIQVTILSMIYNLKKYGKGNDYRNNLSNAYMRILQSQSVVSQERISTIWKSMLTKLNA